MCQYIGKETSLPPTIEFQLSVDIFQMYAYNQSFKNTDSLLGFMSQIIQNFELLVIILKLDEKLLPCHTLLLVLNQ